jgi:hypothetical protein
MIKAKILQSEDRSPLSTSHRSAYAVALFGLACLLIQALMARPARAQYKPIPDYVGIGAGQQFRSDVNNHLSGITPIAPRLVSLPFLQLPREQDGQLYWCTDCAVATPCQGGGKGAMAVG